jgi:GT2 family glycosyltransferase
MGLALTYDAPAALERCLQAIHGQTHKIDEVLIVDNGSDVRVDDIAERFPSTRVQHLKENLGPAGGHAIGLLQFTRSDRAFAWIMDDDCAPEPGALRAQLSAAAERSRPCVILPSVIDATTGERFHGYGWWGALLPREVVEAVGFPNEDLFWWTEDTEYLQWRIPRAGFEVCWSEDATVFVSRTRSNVDKPAWKYYYEARNQVYHRLHVQKPDADQPIPHHLLRRVRAWRAFRTVIRLGARAGLREPTQRLHKLSMVMRGAHDGMRGRLGRTIPADASHRPNVSAPIGREDARRAPGDPL